MVKPKNIPLCLVLSFFSCGLYTLFWMIGLSNDVNSVTETPNQPTGEMCLLLNLCTCGFYSFYWVYKNGEKLDTARMRSGAQYGNLATFYLIVKIGIYGFSYMLLQLNLDIFGFVVGCFDVLTYVMIQNEVNKFVPID